MHFSSLVSLLKCISCIIILISIISKVQQQIWLWIKRQEPVPHLNLFHMCGGGAWTDPALPPGQNVNKLPNSNLSISRHEAFPGQQNMCRPRLRDVRTCLPCLSQTDCKKLTYWSQIVSSPGGNPISPGYLWESSVSPCAWDFEETLESWSRICKHYDDCDTQHWHSENGMFFGFSQGWNWTNQIYCIETVI